MENLQNILADLQRRVGDLEARLAAQTSESMRADLGRAASVPPMLPDNSKMRVKESAVIQNKASDEAANRAGGGAFFGIVGICFLVLAAAFFLKLTVESGWLTPTRQVVLVSFFAVACLGLPHLVQRLADNYGALLSGSGVTMLHLCWLGAYKVHDLIDSRTGLFLATAVGTLSILSNARMANAVFVLVAVAGTYLAVPTLGFSASDLASLSGFLLIWNLSYSILSFLLKRRDVLLVSSYFAIFSAGALSLDFAKSEEMAWQCLGLQAVQFVIFVVATISFTLFHWAPLLAKEASALCLLLLVYYGNLYYLLDIINPNAAPWISAGFSLLVLSIYRAAKGVLKREIPSGPAVMTFAALSLAHSVFLEIIPDTTKPLFALLLAGAMVLANRFGGGSTTLRFAQFVGLGVIAFGALLTFHLDVSLNKQIAYNGAYGLTALLILAFGLVQQSSGASMILGFAHLEMLCALYRLSLKFTSGGSLFVSISWGFYALVILLWAHSRKDRSIGKSAVLILSAVSLKAAFYDMTQTGSLIRILSLLAAGLLLYACGWIYNRMKKWDVLFRKAGDKSANSDCKATSISETAG